MLAIDDHIPLALVIVLELGNDALLLLLGKDIDIAAFFRRLGHPSVLQDLIGS